MSVLPYASVAEFKAYPHDLATSALISGGSAAVQDATLLRQLKRATADAINYLGRDLSAQVVTRTFRGRVASSGVLTYDVPEGRVVSLSSAVVKESPLAAGVSVDVSSAVILDRARVALDVSRWAGRRVYFTLTYVAGFAHTVLSAGAAAADTSVHVADPTGLSAGDVLYLDDVTGPEWVTVASSYTSGSTVALAAPLASAKVSGAEATALPDDTRHAIILWAAGLLSRPSSGGSASAEPFASAARAPGAPFATPLRAVGDTYIAQGMSLLSSTRRVPL